MCVTPNAHNIYLLRIIYPAFILSIAYAVQSIDIKYVIYISYMICINNICHISNRKYMYYVIKMKLGIYLA